MDKHDYIMGLFDDIKDNIEFDSDVRALEVILSKLLEMDLEESFAKWKDLILKYNIFRLAIDIDFIPLVKDYPNKLLEKVGFEPFFKLMSDLPKNKLQNIYQYLFNVYDTDSYIYHSLDYYIKQSNYQDEKKLIYLFLERKKDFFEGFFDQTEFIRRIILMHIASKKISMPLIQELIEIIDNKKEKAVLKTLIIDYI